MLYRIQWMTYQWAPNDFLCWFSTVAFQRMNALFNLFVYVLSCLFLVCIFHSATAEGPMWEIHVQDCPLLSNIPLQGQGLKIVLFCCSFSETFRMKMIWWTVFTDSLWHTVVSFLLLMFCFIFRSCSSPKGLQWRDIMSNIVQSQTIKRTIFSTFSKLSCCDTDIHTHTHTLLCIPSVWGCLSLPCLS